MGSGNKIQYKNDVLEKVNNENSIGKQRAQGIRQKSDNNRVFGTWK